MAPSLAAPLSRSERLQRWQLGSVRCWFSTEARGGTSAASALALCRSVESSYRARANLPGRGETQRLAPSGAPRCLGPALNGKGLGGTRQLAYSRAHDQSR